MASERAKELASAASGLAWDHGRYYQKGADKARHRKEFGEAMRALLTYIESLERDHAAMERLREDFGFVTWGFGADGHYCVYDGGDGDRCAIDPADAILGGSDGDSG